MHRGRSDTAGNANANSDAPRKFASEFLANANGFANEIANVRSHCGIPCEWMFATKFASDCECDGVVHSGEDYIFVGGLS